MEVQVKTVCNGYKVRDSYRPKELSFQWSIGGLLTPGSTKNCLADPPNYIFLYFHSITFWSKKYVENSECPDGKVQWKKLTSTVIISSTKNRFLIFLKIILFCILSISTWHGCFINGKKEPKHNCPIFSKWCNALIHVSLHVMRMLIATWILLQVQFLADLCGPTNFFTSTFHVSVDLM